jgi:single-stranded-DNA-specific exonuclease
MPDIQRRQTHPHLLDTSLHPVLQRILTARGVTSEAEIDYATTHLIPYQDLAGIDSAVQLLARALSQRQHILIVADFDADGATACALGVRALRLLGAAKVSYLVPDRAKHGYGLSPVIADLAAVRQPDVLLTVDNGIASLSGVAQAKQYGMQVLITDHHLPGEHLPAADAIVNPNCTPEDSRRHLAGVGVIFYVMLALRAHLRESGWFEQQNISAPNLANLLDLVALGTVADVVRLDYNNRILVAQGLRRIRQGVCCPGIQALVQMAGREQNQLAASDLGFYLGPRLNAAGRMERMDYGIECLLEDDPRSAYQQAQYLDMFNQDRKAVELDMQSDAWETVRQLEQQATDLPLGLCLFQEHWHEGVIGILASRVKERLHRPVIIFTACQQQGQIKGSARSVNGVHIRDVLNTIHVRYPGMIVKFGGHAMAAGLTLEQAAYQDFSAAFDEEVRQFLGPDDLQQVILSDGELNAPELSLELAELLRDVSPWGQGFPEPIFDGEFILIERRLLKGRHLKMKLQHPEGAQMLDAIAFNTVDSNWPRDVKQVKLAYTLDVNTFRGARTVQLMVKHVAVV